MEYKVTIDKFEGPLDLLLHLIKKSNINIVDINIVDITKQYLDYIKEMEEMNLDIASEYLTMAAELIEMKSKILLPQQEEDVEDDRQNLINRLIDYEQYKQVIERFKTLELDRRDEFTKDPEDLRKYDCVSETHLNKDITLNDLVEAFNIFINKKEKEKPLNTKITTKEYSVTKRSEEIKQILSKRKKITFNELFKEYNKSYIVVTFLAILNLSKKENIKLKQENNFKEIYIEVS
jgi:segregation and condensation protein A